MTEPCPTKDCTGTLTVYRTTTRSTGQLEKYRQCKCCGRKEIALLRPVELISVRTVQPGFPELEKSPTPNKKHRR